MKKTAITLWMLILVFSITYGQSGDINNTLGPGGTFSIKDGSTTFLTLSQSDGYLDVNNCLTLPATTSSTLGVIFKGTTRFIHNYTAPGADGRNTFVGLYAGNFTMPGSGAYSSNNTSVGYNSLTSLTYGYDNSSFGMNALYSNTTGTNNSAFGNSSLYSCTNGYYNSAFGFNSLVSNVAGNDNTAIGAASLGGTTGNNNTALGYSAGSNITSGSNNTCLGNDADASSATATNEITLGNSSVTTLRCQVTSITSLSDVRDKRNVRDLPLGLEFLMSVKPRLFNWDRRDWYANGKSDGSKMQATPTAGFIAQELDENQKNNHAEWLNLVLKSNADRLEATPGNLLPIIVKAIQELKGENDLLKQEIATLRASVASQVKDELKKALLNTDKQGETKTKMVSN